ncbi:DNA-binding response OmpR family regulator [Sphingobium fontiphilum]|uniref:DNA-binding response OmpR family regulator n=1 Tax=Sphingobium fontiphilum TaxID=944425 RepID=A0A7W6DL47_9SPHN|nr:response regulator [Sphingobium fontiphilum]MBB3982587.1 DNA-binding response OmpR family regulator [Sphingobium fontiphilum]
MSKRVLIVEDEIFVALEIEQAVEAASFDVVAIAADRASALAVADQCDIALVDLNLRDGPTGTVIGTTLAQSHGVRVIYVTANPAQIGGASSSALGVVVKPFREASIIAALKLAATDNGDPLAADISGFTPFPPPGSLSGMGSSA